MSTEGAQQEATLLREAIHGAAPFALPRDEALPRELGQMRVDARKREPHASRDLVPVGGLRLDRLEDAALRPAHDGHGVAESGTPRPGKTYIIEKDDAW